MFKKAFAVVMLFSAVALADNLDLDCRATSPAKGKKRTVSLEVRKITETDDTGTPTNEVLKIRDRRSGTIRFDGNEIRIKNTEHVQGYKIILADNGFFKARIVVNSAGHADVSVTAGSDDNYVIARKMTSCSKF